jgi:PAS domain S-box-containing protein
MMSAPLPPTEQQRLKTLLACDLLDTAEETGYDDIARLAARLFDAPIGLISLVDADRQWFKAHIGLDVRETPRDLAFCAHAILQQGVLVVADAQADERFRDNPLVAGAPHIRFYAGAPLTMPDGQNIGTLCVIDVVPHAPDAPTLEALRVLADQVIAHIELRRKVAELENASVQRAMVELQLKRFNDEVLGLVTLRTKELQAERDRAELYFDVAGGMMVVTDSSGRILKANRMAAEVLCRESPELPGKDWFDLCFPPDARAEARSFFAELIGGQSQGDRRFRGLALTSDGRARTIAWRTTRLFDGDGKVSGLLGVGEDITDALEAEERLRRTLVELERSNLALQQFVHVASHDLREPINSILNFSSLLARDLDASEATRVGRYIDFIRRGGQRMRTLVDDLLAYVRIENSERHMDLVELSDSAEDVRQALADAIEKSGAVLRVGPLPAIYGDRTLIGLLLQNLVSNAIKFRHPEVAAVIDILATDTGHGVRISVCDNGIGIPPEYHEKIFEAFQRLHSRTEYEGSGLGLALCRRIADIHGATLGVRSTEGAGSCFELTLPASNLSAIEPLALPETEPG